MPVAGSDANVAHETRSRWAGVGWPGPVVGAVQAAKHVTQATRPTTHAVARENLPLGGGPSPTE